MILDFLFTSILQSFLNISTGLTGLKSDCIYISVKHQNLMCHNKSTHFCSAVFNYDNSDEWQSPEPDLYQCYLHVDGDSFWNFQNKKHNIKLHTAREM